MSGDFECDIAMLPRNNLRAKEATMNTLKKMMMKRALKKSVRNVETAVKRAYKDVSKDVTKRLSGMKMPVKVTISR